MNNKIPVSLTLAVLVLMMSTLNLTIATKEEPKFEVILTSHSLKIPTEPEEKVSFDSWLYITNPSKEMEREGTDVFHSIKVNWVNLTYIEPDGSSYWMVIYPDGTVMDPDGQYYMPGLGSRIRTIVYPMEKALVFYVGWSYSLEWGIQRGIYTFIYTVNTEYEEQTFELIETFQVTLQ